MQKALSRRFVLSLECGAHRIAADAHSRPATSSSWPEHYRQVLRRNRTRTLNLSPKHCNRLLVNEWKGNIRELENCIERAVILARRQRHRDAPPAAPPKA
jgi:transcriptional regulator of aromatic amino acid metabolism